MSIQNITSTNNNKEVKVGVDTSVLKVFEVTTNADEIITIKKEPLDFVEYNACDTQEEPKLSAVAGSLSHEGVVVRYQIEKWNSNDGSKTVENKNILQDTDEDDLDNDNKDFDEEDDEDIDISDFDEDSEEEDDNQASKSVSGIDEDEIASAQDSPSSEPEDEDDVCTTTEFNGMKIESKGQYSMCPVCNKKIKSTFIFRHIKLHNQPTQKYPCPEKRCDLVVNRINNLFRHLKVVHASKKPYLCKYDGCKERFAKSATLRSHLAVHRAETRKIQAEKEISNEEENTKKFTCEFPGCGKEYGKRHHLKEHERKHTGDMRFTCEVCGKKFYMHAHMKRHLYSHTGIKPHVCRWKCGAIFASYGGRMKHERINHYEENPLQRFIIFDIKIT